ncbi:MAG: adenylosuccinate lyase, partial [Acidaminococcaceae bacterium]|nr:adenylosuccinate lyase [Acidaminococcaceae bacterium]
MAAHVIDNLLLQNSFGTEEMRAVWDEKNRLQKQLDVERALAEAEGELNVIPKAAAATIAAAADSSRFDLQELAVAGLTSKHSLIATIKRLQELAGRAGEFVHYGATTQDIVDTGTVLQLKEAHKIILRDLKKLLSQLVAA